MTVFLYNENPNTSKDHLYTEMGPRFQRHLVSCASVCFSCFESLDPTHYCVPMMDEPFAFHKSTSGTASRGNYASWDARVALLSIDCGEESMETSPMGVMFCCSMATKVILWLDKSGILAQSISTAYTAPCQFRLQHRCRTQGTIS